MSGPIKRVRTLLAALFVVPLLVLALTSSLASATVFAVVYYSQHPWNGDVEINIANTATVYTDGQVILNVDYKCSVDPFNEDLSGHIRATLFQAKPGTQDYNWLHSALTFGEDRPATCDGESRHETFTLSAANDGRFTGGPAYAGVEVYNNKGEGASTGSYVNLSCFGNTFGCPDFARSFNMPEAKFNPTAPLYTVGQVALSVTYSCPINRETGPNGGGILKAQVTQAEPGTDANSDVPAQQVIGDVTDPVKCDGETHEKEFTIVPRPGGGSFTGGPAQASLLVQDARGIGQVFTANITLDCASNIFGCPKFVLPTNVGG